MIIMCIDPKLSEEPVKTREMLTKKKNGKVKRMYCSKCGAKVEGMFCPNCGAKMEQKAAEVPENKATTPVTQPAPPKTEPAPPVTQPKPASGATATKTAVPVAKSADTKKLGLIVGAVVAVIVVIAIVSSVVKNVKNSPEWRLNKALDDRDIELALEIYREEYEEDEELSEKSIKKISEWVEEIKSSYFDETIDYGDAYDEICEFNRFWLDEVDELVDAADLVIEADYYVKCGNSALENGDYSYAESCFSHALDYDEANPTAQAGLKSAEEGLKQEALEEIKAVLSWGEFYYAEEAIEEYNEKYGESQEVVDAYEAGALEFVKVCLDVNNSDPDGAADIIARAEKMGADTTEMKNEFIEYAEENMQAKLDKGDYNVVANMVANAEAYGADVSEMKEAMLEGAKSIVSKKASAGEFTTAASLIGQIEGFGVTVSELVDEFILHTSMVVSKKGLAGNFYEAELTIQDAYEAFVNYDSANSEYVKTSLDAMYKWDVVDRARLLAKDSDYEGAFDAISRGKEYFGDNADVLEAADEINTMYEQYLSDEVMTLADGGNWDGALEKLDEYQTLFPSSQILSATRDEIESTMPITLENLTLVSGNEIKIYEEAVKDRWGNLYDGAVRYGASSKDSYGIGLYNLNKNFTRFTGVAFVGQNDDNNTKDEVSLSIYLDEKLVYFADEITTETAPMALDIDVTNATTMRIVVATPKGNQFEGDSYRGLYFGNTNFERPAAEEQPTEE